MEEQADKTKKFYKRRSRSRVILLGFASLFIAIGFATFLTVSTDKEFRPQGPPQKTTGRVAVIRITPSGFEPSTLSVKKGTRVVWTNTDTGLHQVASNPYPLNNDVPGLRSEILGNAQAYTYVVHAVGSVGYHDQLRPTINGTIVVRE